MIRRNDYGTFSKNALYAQVYFNIWTFYRKKLNIGKLYFLRYMRYTPSVAVILLFMLSFLPYALVNGPSIRFLNTNVERCQNSWWLVLLMIQNYVNINEAVSSMDDNFMSYYLIYNPLCISSASCMCGI
jgi:hypothetical protein